MTDRPIIFSAPMVRALLDGRKTQTRRLLPSAHPRFPHHNQIRQDVIVFDPHRPEVWYWDGHHDRVGASYPLRYAPGDRLYVREAFRGATGYDAIPPAKWGNKPLWYDADGEPNAKVWWHLSDRSHPSIHMPRWASRLTLTVTEVRVQRLQDISEADAEAEGIERLKSGRGFYDPTVGKAAVRFGEWTSTARQGFCCLWNSLHGPDAWDANPWVVAVSFSVRKGNIDAQEVPS